MKKVQKHPAMQEVLHIMGQKKLLSTTLFVVVAGSVAAALLPPLVLEKIVNLLTGKEKVSFLLIFSYFALIALSGVLDAARESLLAVFGQKITHGLRQTLCEKLSRLPADYFAKQEPGVTVSRFVGDVDTIEALFTSGIISMFADACKVLSIFVVIFIKNKGLALTLLFIVPLLFWFTRAVQKRMLAAQLYHRAAVARVSNHVPETIRCIRTIHTLHKETYMRDKYDSYIQESYTAMERTNFYDAVYSPVILILNAVVVAVVMLLSATGNTEIQAFFGMSVGTAVAVISYVSQVFSPLESIGMEIQTIQSAVAGLRRINEFLELPERWSAEECLGAEDIARAEIPSVELRNVSFGYGQEKQILKDLSFVVEKGEQVMLTGRTGAGKSTVFKLLLGLYRPDSGKILIHGKEAAKLSDIQKRKIFGYVEQRFRMVPGTVEEQITLFEESLTQEQVEKAAKIVGLHETILRLEKGYDTPCTPALLSQGQWQLLSIARAIVAEPDILLLDEITANLDSDTDRAVLEALQNASENRTVLSISHRLFEQTGMRQIPIA